jgi:arsenate reductase (thioredoxin)
MPFNDRTERNPMLPYRTRILFLCAAGASRSQLAEAWANHLGGDYVVARSAGSEICAPDAHAAAVLRETGVTSPQASMPLTPELLRWAHLIVTLDDHWSVALSTLPPRTRTRHWTLADPVAANGTEAKPLHAFRTARDEIRYRVANLIVELCANRRILACGA